MAEQLIDWKEVVDELKDLLIQEAQNFLKDNGEDVAALGKETVLAILQQKVDAVMPPVWNLFENASTEMLVNAQERLAARGRVAQLISKAKKQDAERVAALEANAIGVAGKIASIIGSVGVGIVGKVLLGL